MKFFGGWKANRSWRNVRKNRGMTVTGLWAGGGFTFRRLCQWMARSVRIGYGSLFSMPLTIPVGYDKRTQRGNRRAMAEAVRASMESLETRTLLTALPSSILYVNDNWRVHVGGPNSGTVENTGLGDDKSLSNLTLGVNAFNSLTTASLWLRPTPPSS